MNDSIPLHDLEALDAWIQAAPDGQALEPLLALDVVRIRRLVYERAPARAVQWKWVEEALVNLSTGWGDSLADLLALAANRNLPVKVVKRLYAELQQRLLRYRDRDVKRGAMPSELMDVVHALERAGYPVPAGFLDPFWERIRRKNREEKDFLPFHAYIILERWGEMEPEELHELYGASRNRDSLHLKIARHPNTDLALLRKIYRQREGEGGGRFAEAILSRPEAAADPEMRRAVLEGDAWAGHRALLPSLSGEEHRALLLRYAQAHGISRLRSLLAERSPSPSLFREVFATVAAHAAPEALQLLEEGVENGLTGALKNEDLLPLFGAYESEVRLRAQLLWGRFQEAEEARGSLPPARGPRPPARSA